jgi:hypothetical protein
MRIVLLLLALSVGQATASELTANERAELRELRATFEESCRTKLRAELGARSVSPAPIAMTRWISAIADPAEYCGCATAGFFDDLTADFVRHGTGEQGAAKAKRAGTACVLPKLKASFPAFCGDMVREMTPVNLRSSKGDEIIAEMCRCTEPAVNAISVESFEAFASTSLRDYANYQHTQVLPPPSMKSLIAQMNACGFSELRTRLEEAK